MKTSEILNRAADDLERFGWCVANWWPEPTAPACVEGAMKRVCSRDIEDYSPHTSYFPAKAAFRAHVGTYGWVWNDAPGRTKEEVIEALRACAVIEAAKESSSASIEVPVA